MIVLYGLAAVVGLVVFTFGSIGVLIVLAPDMRYESAMWFILAAGLLGAVAGPMLLRRIRLQRRRGC